MIFHFTKMALKAIWRFKLHSVINMLSLVFGFFCFIVAALFTNYINSFDKNFLDSHLIYTIAQGQAGGARIMATTPKPTADYLRNEFSELEYVVRATPPTSMEVTEGGVTDPLNIRFVERGFLKIFPIPMLEGIQTGADLQPNTALITENAAIRRFGNIDVIGKSLLIAHSKEVTIVGVTRKFDHPSHIESALPPLSSDLIVPIEIYDVLLESALPPGSSDTEGWGISLYYTYIKFKPDTVVDEESFQLRLEDFVNKTVPETWSQDRTFVLQPINKLTTSTVKIFTGGVDPTIILFLAGCLVLFIGALNYSNLVIAQLSLRSQEIGVQKILGAGRFLLIAQYCYESLLFVSLALLITLLALIPLLISFGNIGWTGVGIGLLFTPELWTKLVLVLATIIVITGAYPALRTLNVTLVTLMRPKGLQMYSGWLRAFMVAIQFIISGTLIILSMVMFSQNRALTTEIAGNVADPKIVVTVPVDALTIDRELLVNEWEKNSNIVSVTTTREFPWSIVISTVEFSRSADLDAPVLSTVSNSVDYNYFLTADIPLIAGRSFSKARANDVYPSLDALSSAQGPYSIILDETTVQKLGWENVDDAVGQTIYQHYAPPQVQTATAVERIIVGVTEDKNFKVINYGAFGMGGHSYSLQPENTQYLIIRISKENIEDALAYLDSSWKELLPQVAFKRLFMGEIFIGSFQLFVGLSATITALSIVGFVIASIGLLGNATFATNIRRREVGIRKVMGASSSRLMRMLLLDFSRPIVIANLIAWPLGYVVARGYLSLFSMQISLTLMPFIVSFILSVLIAFLAVASQSWKSSQIRPAMILRYE